MNNAEAQKEDDFVDRLAAVPTYYPRPVPYVGETVSFASFFRNVVSNPVASVPGESYRSKTKLYSWPMAQVLFANEPSVVEEVLLKRFRDFPKSEVDQRVFGSAAKKGILIADGDDWRWRRKLAAPFFQPKALEHHVPDMVIPFEDLVDRWKAQPAGAPIFGAEAMIDATFHMVTATLFSKEEREIISDFPQSLEEYLEPIPWIVGTATLGFPRWFPFPGRKQFLHGIVKMRRAMVEALAYRRKHDVQRKDLTTALINACDDETGRKFTDVDIVDMLMTMIAAGHETTAHAMTWMLYNLAKQPELQELLAEEVERASGGKPFTRQSLEAMVNLEAFINESMRVHPSVPLLTRMSAKDQELGGFKIKKGAVIFLPILAIQRHEDLWEEPNKFDHTRFLRKEPSTLSRSTFLPFGVGPRVCIGNSFAMLEMLAGLATLLRKVRLRTRKDTDDFTFMHLLTLKPSNGLPLDVEFL